MRLATRVEKTIRGVVVTLLACSTLGACGAETNQESEPEAPGVTACDDTEMAVATVVVSSIDQLDYNELSNTIADLIDDRIDFADLRSASIRWLAEDGDRLLLELPGAQLEQCERIIADTSWIVALEDSVVTQASCTCALDPNRHGPLPEFESEP